MSIGLHIRLIYSIICLLKASILLKMKVVPNDNFLFGVERINIAQTIPNDIILRIVGAVPNLSS